MRLLWGASSSQSPVSVYTALFTSSQTLRGKEDSQEQAASLIRSPEHSKGLKLEAGLASHAMFDDSSPVWTSSQSVMRLSVWRSPGDPHTPKPNIQCNHTAPQPRAICSACSHLSPPLRKPCVSIHCPQAIRALPQKLQGKGSPAPHPTTVPPFQSMAEFC